MMMNLVSLLLFIAVVLSTTTASILIEAKSYFRGEYWTNFSLLPTASSGFSDRTFLFVPLDKRGAGTILYSQSQAGGIYGAAVEGYKYGAITPREYNVQINATRLTLDGQMQICPDWYSPPSVHDMCFTSLNNPSLNQTVASPDFHVIGNALNLDNKKRLVIHSDVLQMLVRFEVTANQLESTVRNDPTHGKSTADSQAVVGDYNMSVLWGSWCNGTHLPFTNRPYVPPQDAPANASLTLVEFLEAYNVHDPSFLPDGSLIFSASSFQCVFHVGESTNWMVHWWLGNCTADPWRPISSYATPQKRQVTDCSGIRSIYVHVDTRKVYLSERVGTVREIDLDTDMVRLVMGNTTNFVPYAANCDETTACSPFIQQFFIRHMAVVPNVVSEVNPAETTTMLYALDSTFVVLYAVDINAQRLYTELVVDWSGSSPHNYRDDCTPVQVAASFADVYVLCHGGEQVVRKRLLLQDPLPEPVVALPTVDGVSMTAITAVTTITSLTGLPTVAVTAGRARSIIALARCDVTMERGSPLSWVESPTQLSIGNSDFRFFSGAVIGNLCIIIVGPMLIHFLVVRFMFWRAKRKIHQEQQRQLEAEIAKFTSISSINTNNGDESEKEKSLLSPTTASLSLAAGIDVSSRGTIDSKKGGKKSNNNPHEERLLLETQARLRYPSASFVFALMFTIEPTVRCGAYLMRYADPSHPDNMKFAEDNPANLETRWEFIVGIVGLVITLFGVIAIALFFAYKFTAVFYPIPTKTGLFGMSDDDDDEDTQAFIASSASVTGGADGTTANPGPGHEYNQKVTASVVLNQEDLTCMQKARLIVKIWYTKWKRISKPHGEWKDHRNEQPRRFGGLIKPYIERGRWWSVAELLSAGCLAALAGFKTKETCMGTAIMSVLILWLFFIGLICVRPMASPFDNFLQSLIAGLGAFSGLLVLAAAVPFSDSQDFIHSCFTLAETLALAAAFLVGVEAFFDVGNRAFKLLKFMMASCCTPPPPPKSPKSPKSPKDQNKKKKRSSSANNNKNTVQGYADADSLNNNPSKENNTNNSVSPIVIDTTPDSKGSNGTTQLAFSFDMPKEDGMRIAGTDGRQGSSGSGTGTSTGRTASSDMDLFDAVAKQIARATKKQNQQYKILKNRTAMNLPPSANADTRGSNGTGSSNSAPSFLHTSSTSADVTPHTGNSQPQFLSPPQAAAAARILLNSSSSASSMSTINGNGTNRSSMGSQQSSSDHSFLRGLMGNNNNKVGKVGDASPTPRQSTTTTTYKLDDDSSDSFSRADSIDALMSGKNNDTDSSNESEKIKKKERTMMMEYEILRAKLKHELDTGNNHQEGDDTNNQNGNDDDDQQGGGGTQGYSSNMEI